VRGELSELDRGWRKETCGRLDVEGGFTRGAAGSSDLHPMKTAIEILQASVLASRHYDFPSDGTRW
jgi:hypothetical protein